MLTGPTVINCFSSADGFGQCVQTRLADAGLLPRPATPPVVAGSEEAVAAISEEAAEPEEAIAEPALDVTPAEEPIAVPDNLIAATFGLLRAEPDGSVVIAGSGTPGSEIEVYANGSLLGRATVETSGDWVLVPDAPLPPGPLEITLGEKGKTGQAGQSFVVVINEDKKSQPLVVASTPGEASDILQGLERPQVAEVAQVPATDPVQPPSTAVPSTQPQPPAETTVPAEAPAAAIAETPQAEAPASAEPSSAPAAPDSTPTPVEAAATPQATVPATPAAPDAPVATAQTTEPAAAIEAPAAPVETAQPEISPPAEPVTRPELPAATAPATEETAIGDEPQPATEQLAAPEPQTQIAAVEQPSEPSTAPSQPSAPASIPPTIDAIEIEGGKTFFAGAGPDGATVRLYVDNSFVADTQVEGGRWLVEAGSVLTKPSQRIRVDLLQPGSATVIGRAEVDFLVELPPGEEPTAIATAEPAPQAIQPEASTETASPAAEPAPPATAQVTPPAATAPSAQPAAPADNTAPNPAPAAPAGSTSTAVSETPATPAAQPATADAPVAQTPASQPAQAVPSAATANAATPETPAVAPAPATSAEATPDIPTMVAVSIGGADAQRFAAGKAIIRRGDNLWTIARRVYGTGIKFTTIYEANAGQIRDPDRIYPGQVFNLPTQ